MARNDERRQRLTDAALTVLAREGARGLTHRAVDDEASVPRGTASNYFHSRQALVAACATRIGERLAPDPVVHAALAPRPRSRATFAAYLRDIVTRLLEHRDVTLALLELRMEAARRPDVRERLGAWLREGYAADVDFNREAGLPGGPEEIALFHYAIDGLILDRLTASIDPDASTDAVVDRLVDGLLPEA